ncbi:hypothetical protein PVAP13_8KG208301 [Panicum virgatum]|uniref:Uncharacterized protein n=1 Tax=Panicum virgatum TaxID=38727 RepID=A0A8T0PKL9_PANVG|nr:hypothetical protein PVAP13_8KG208301 [Panicum virgatum]
MSSSMEQPPPPPHKSISSRHLPDLMEQRSSGSHGGTSGGVRPPLPTAGTPAKTRRRTFVAPASLPTVNPSNSGLPRHQEVPNSGFPRRQEMPNSGLPPRRHELLYPGGAPRHNPLTATFTEPASPPPGSTTCWDTRSTSSSPLMEYDAAGTSEPILVRHWTARHMYVYYHCGRSNANLIALVS